jgi:hypothetical protein
MKTSCLLLLVLSASFAVAQDNEHWFISPDNGPEVSKQTAATLLKAACEGEVKGNSCSKCPDSEDGSWAIHSVLLGHFSSPRSEEALVGTGGVCSYSNSSGVGATILLGKRNGKWIKLENVMAFELDHCMKKTLRSSREFLMCESNDYFREGTFAYMLASVMVENEELKFHNLLTAADTTKVCMEGRAQKAEVKNIEFRDLNGDGLEDISIAATYGAFEMTGRRKEQCDAASDDFSRDVKPGKKFPQPSVMKTYKIDLLFDGNRYTPTPESSAAVALFHWDR